MSAFSTFALTNIASADDATAKRFADYAYSANIASGIQDMQKTASEDSSDAEAQFATGALQFFHALEGLQQDLFRLGVGNQQIGGQRGLAAMLPILRVPVAPNPNPEIADYKKVRKVFEQFVDRLILAEATLAQVGDGPVKLPLNVMRVSLDMNANGKSDEGESLAGVLSMLGGRRNVVPAQALMNEIAFDAADAKWLQGYSNLLMSIGNFFLSFDFEKSYDASFHAVFGTQATEFGKLLESTKGDPEEIAQLESEISALEAQMKAVWGQKQRDLQKERNRKSSKIARDKQLSSAQKREKRAALNVEYKELREARAKQSTLRRQIRTSKRRLASLDPTVTSGRDTFQSLADPIGFLHSISWPVVEPDRLKAVRQNLLTMAKLNQDTWRLARAETDDDREWLPNANQKGPFETLQVTDSVIDSWLKTMEVFESMLEGEVLVPSWRFGRGVNMKRFFEEATEFDLVLFLTGPNSAKFVEKGPVMDQGLFRTLSSPMGRNFGSFAVWFN